MILEANPLISKPCLTLVETSFFFQRPLLIITAATGHFSTSTGEFRKVQIEIADVFIPADQSTVPLELESGGQLQPPRRKRGNGSPEKWGTLDTYEIGIVYMVDHVKRIEAKCNDLAFFLFVLA